MLYVVIQRRVAAEHRGYRVNQKYSQYRNYYRNQHRRREGQRKQSVRLAVVALSLRDGNAYRAADPEQEEERLHKKHNRLGQIYRRKRVVTDKRRDDDSVHERGEQNRH